MSDPSKKKSGTETYDKKRLPDKIGNSLRQMYEDVLNEDVPDDFLDLLRKADQDPSE